jgi:uncharacterized Zn-finger protein
MTSDNPQNANRVVQLDSKDLTQGGEAWCPHPKANMQAWSSHPKVYLNLSGGKASCPYCGTVYRLNTLGMPRSV